jgi:hypothetical protein
MEQNDFSFSTKEEQADAISFDVKQSADAIIEKMIA